MTGEAAHPRLVREHRTIGLMIGLYCRGNHQQGEGLCRDCRGLLDYARQRIDVCPYQERKGTCLKCPVHCYEADRREEIRKVMRYSGPRMLLRHPVLTIRHLMDSRHSSPGKPKIDKI